MEFALTLFIITLAFVSGWFSGLVWWEVVGSGAASRKRRKQQLARWTESKDSNPLLSAVSQAERDSALSMERRQRVAMEQISELTQSAKKGLSGGQTFHAGTGFSALGR